MRAFAGDDDLEDVESPHQRPDAHRKRAHRLARPVVHAVDRAHRKPIEQPLLDHHPAAAFVLLCRLEDEIDRAVEVPLARQCCRRAQEHRCVPVVTASVHLALDARGVRDAGTLENVERIEVGAQADGFTAAAMAHDADDTGLGEARMHFEPERSQLVRDERAGTRLFERGFRVRMNVVTPRFHFRDERGDFGDDVHAVCGSRGRMRDVSADRMDPGSALE